MGDACSHRGVLHPLTAHVNDKIENRYFRSHMNFYDPTQNVFIVIRVT